MTYCGLRIKKKSALRIRRSVKREKDALLAESEIVSVLRKRFGGESFSVVKGIGDDAAVIRIPGATQYWAALLCLANWVGNVILPVYGGVEIARAVLGVGGFFERLYIGDDWIRHFVAGGACLCVSGLMRLMEHFVSAGTGGVA